MKNRLLPPLLLLLACLALLSSCRLKDQTGGTENAPPSTPATPTGSYELLYTSNGDGTCTVTGITLSPDAANLTVKIPEVSPDGETVVTIEKEVFSTKNLPEVITEELFHAHISVPLVEQVRAGKLSIEQYQRTIDRFIDNPSPDAKEADVEDLRSPMEQVTEVRYLHRLTLPEISAVLAKYAGYTSEDLAADLASMESKYGVELQEHTNTDAIVGLILPDTMTEIPQYAFSGMHRLEQIRLPRTITHLPYGVLFGCTALLEIDIPESVMFLDGNNFAYCYELKEVAIRGTIAKFPSCAFADCEKIERVEISNIYKWMETRFVEPASNPLHAGADLYVNGKLLTELEIPYGAKTISQFAFYGCESLTEVTLVGGNLSTMQRNAFTNCKNLERVNVADPEAFCRINFEVGSNPLENGAELWHNGQKVTTLILPEAVTSISPFAFMGCTSLERVVLTGNLSTVGAFAFAECPNLTSLYVGANVRTFYRCAFIDCKQLSRIELDDLASWCEINFDGPYSNPLEESHGDLFYRGELVTDLVIPDGVGRIRNQTFAYCHSLKSVTVPESVHTIESHAFEGCPQLARVIIKDGVQTIGDHVFASCPQLKALVIPASVQAITGQAWGYENSVLYAGTSAQWASILAPGEVKNSVVYYYTETPPTPGVRGWYYDENGAPVRWETESGK